MINQVNNSFLYRSTSKIEENTMMNRGVTDICGFAVPNALMTNNRVEAVERFSRSMLFFICSFIAPLAIVRYSNKFFAKRILDLTGNEAKIIQLSNKYLKNTEDMKEGIKDLHNSLAFDNNYSEKVKNEHKEAFEYVLEKYPSKEELRSKLIKAKNCVLGSDLILSGLMIGSVPWGINYMTKHFTKRSGFTAEFEMADKEYVDKSAEKYEKSVPLRYAIVASAVIANGLAVPAIVFKSLKSKNPGKFLSKVKNNAHLFDYTKGIYIKRLPFVFMELVADTFSCTMSSRDSHEVKDWLIRFAVFDALLFGGDLFLNNIFGRVIDKFANTKLMNNSKVPKDAPIWKKMFLQSYSLKELNEGKLEGIKAMDKKVLENTKKYAVRMYWLNFALVLLGLGIGTPYLLNKILKKDVKEKSKGLKNSNPAQTVNNNDIIRKYQELQKSKSL